jgi:hypothetical protein
MRQLEPSGPGRRIAEALSLLLAVAVGTRWAYDLLRPLVPVAITGLCVTLILMALLRRRHW